MKHITLIMSSLALALLSGCDDDVKVVEKDVVVTNTIVEVVEVPTPVIVEVAKAIHQTFN
jgi:glycerophosphoryl diester phosphodiesterase